MRHEQIVPADQPLHPRYAPSPPGRAPTLPFYPQTAFVRLSKPACEWQCTHCSVRCATAVNMMRDDRRRRARLLAVGPDHLDETERAELKRLDWNLTVSKEEIHELRGEAMRAEFQACAQEAAIRAEQRRARRTRIARRRARHRDRRVTEASLSQAQDPKQSGPCHRRG